MITKQEAETQARELRARLVKPSVITAGIALDQLTNLIIKAGERDAYELVFEERKQWLIDTLKDLDSLREKLELAQADYAVKQNLIDLQVAYIKFLYLCDSESAGFLQIHGWKYKPELILDGEIHRNKIEVATKASESTNPGQSLVDNLAKKYDALRHAKQALTWSRPVAGNSCNGEVSKAQAEEWYDLANEKIDEAL